MQRSRQIKLLGTVGLLNLSIMILSVAPLSAQEDIANPIERFVGHYLTGSGQWRAPNPNFEPGGAEPKEFGLNYRWGPHEKHVIAEIVSIFEDGRQDKDWSLYFVFNPVTDQALIFQTGGSGVFFEGEFELTNTSAHTQTGLVYLPNGVTKSVRDEVFVIDKDTLVSHVFERDEAGEWIKVREWTWQQLPKTNRQGASN